MQGEVKILLLASCYGNWDKLLPDGPLGLYADLIIKKNYFFDILIQEKKSCLQYLLADRFNQ